ncbi:uncharacterized protein ARMOST_11406 [Armillaria ostoyae]|uniref:Uncharacterized protein n=1 Tax=Armillaria ostoyae TaxID=47428 RepID=A0A284RH43_ARMOS|nr:uncharacterized protein ARMOST_11406 [Armillaria ostoyae]
MSSAYLWIHGWRLIPLPRHLWTVAHWTYESVMMLYQGDNGKTIDAKTKLDAVKVNGSWDELHLLAERHSSSHSPGREVVEVTPGVHLPYTRPLIVIPNDSSLSDQPQSEIVIESELMYPFDELMLDNRLPTPGLIAMSSQLPSNPSTNASLIPTLPTNVEDLMREVFGNCSRETSMSPFLDSHIAVPRHDHL